MTSKFVSRFVSWFEMRSFVPVCLSCPDLALLVLTRLSVCDAGRDVWGEMCGERRVWGETWGERDGVETDV